LLLADSYYPGWRAYVAGKEKKIELAQGAFRGMMLPAGEHKIDFYYRPTTFKVGLFAFLLALMASGMLFGGALISHAEKK